MSSNYMISDLSMEEKDPIQRIGKNALLQFVTLDYLILKTYETLVRRFRGGSAVMTKVIFNNPYHLDEYQLEYLVFGNRFTGAKAGIGDANKDTGKEKKDVDRDAIKDTGKEKKDVDREAVKDTDMVSAVSAGEPMPVSLSDRIHSLESGTKKDIDNVLSFMGSRYPTDLFKIYTICLALQRLWSYVFVNTRRVYDFKVDQEIAELQRSSNFYATYDRPNSEASEYYVESLEAKILAGLREANSGTPVMEEVEDILVEVALHCGFLLKDNLERMELESEGFVKEEQNEKDLLRILFPERDDTSVPMLSSLLEKSGLVSIFDKVGKYLPNNIFDLLNSEILNSLVNTWGPLFTEMQPEILDILASLIPTIPDRFRMSSSRSDEQEVIRKGALMLMDEFLEAAILPIRISDLRDVLDKPSANSALYYFRSLLVLVDQKIGIDPGTDNYHSPWDSRHLSDKAPPWEPDPFHAGRINYLRLLHWALTDEKELGELFRYARSLYDDEVERTRFFEGIAKDKFNELVPSAMFPGTLESSDVLPMGGMLIDMNYQRQQKNKTILLTRLGRVGGVESALKDVKVRWMP